ncbi:hypothetical protein IAQ61_007424 [Plenodomus lingam]|nr:hypothetical protein IAQ61_007424 [Plenodomus lingam]
MMASPERMLIPVAAFSSAFLAGGMNLVSMIAVPMILKTTPPDSSLLLRQWHFIYSSGHKVGPKLAVASGLLYWTAAWTTQERGKTIALYAYSGALTMSMVPFTWLFIVRINNAIFAEIEKNRAGTPTNLADAQYLVGRWRKLNIARTVFPILGAALGLITLSGLVR